MGQLKAHEVEGWLARPQAGVPIVLLYGPDRGLVSERAKRFAEKSGVPLDDPFSVVKLDASEMEKDPGRLLDEANTVPMFAGRRLLWVRNAQAQKALADDIKALCESPPIETTILIEAGDLKKGAALRTAVESGKAAIALPCYADDSRSIDSVIDDELRKANISIDPEARVLLHRSLGGDRMATRAEVAKLMIYAMGQESITIDDVRSLTGDVSAVSTDEAIDAILSGDVSAFDSAFFRQVVGSSQVYSVLSALQRQLQSLQLMRGAMEREGRNAASVLGSARPPVFFARRQLVERALSRWDTLALGQFLTQLHETILLTRQRPDLAVAIAHRTLTQIALKARRQS